MNLNQIKKEAREEANDRKYDGWSNFGKRDLTPEEEAFNRGVEGTSNLYEQHLDRLVNEIEKAVVPEEDTARCYEECDEDRQFGFNKCRDKIQEAFTRFKGESQFVPEPNDIELEDALNKKDV